MKNHIVIIGVLTGVLFGCQAIGTTEKTSATPATSSGVLSEAALRSALQVFGSQTTTDIQGLSSLVQESTGVSSSQAMGGVGSLLALAQNSLVQSQNNELSRLLPGYDQVSSTGLSSLITNQSALDTAFSGLGLSPSMVNTVAPVLINVLTNQGASPGLIQSLSSLWQ